MGGGGGAGSQEKRGRKFTTVGEKGEEDSQGGRKWDK